MTRAINRISPTKLKTKTPGMYADGGGLYLQVTLGAQKQIRRSWVFRFAINGGERFKVVAPKPGSPRSDFTAVKTAVPSGMKSFPNELLPQ